MNFTRPTFTHAALAALVTLSPCIYAQQIEATSTTPTPAVAEPQYSAITSTDNVVQISRLPIVYNGKIYYEDVNLTFDYTVDTATNPATLEVRVTPEETASATPSNAFKAGTYIGPSNVNGDKSIIVVTGPSPLSGGGSGWTLTTNTSSSTATYPSSAVWYVEDIGNNPDAPRLKAAGITSEQLYYGTGDSGSNPNNEWPNNAILGFSQVGNTLTISSFTNSYCCGETDHSTPVDQITYTLQQ